LEQLWISYNKVEKLAPIVRCTKITTLYMAHNYVKSMDEFSHLAELPLVPPAQSLHPPQLTDLVFLGNPLEEEWSENEEYNNKVVR
jgi:dynein light chain 1